MRRLLTSWLDFMLIFVPITVGRELLHPPPLIIFHIVGGHYPARRFPRTGN